MPALLSRLLPAADLSCREWARALRKNTRALREAPGVHPCTGGQRRAIPRLRLNIDRLYARRDHALPVRRVFSGDALRHSAADQSLLGSALPTLRMISFERSERVRLTRVTLHFGNSERHCRRCNGLSIDKLRGASIFQQTIRVASLT